MATAAAFGVAAVLLVVAILPAEYGIDPLGTGRALGLTALAGADDSAPAAEAPRADASSVGAVDGAPAPASTLKQDLFEVELRPFEGVEYKYRLEEGASLVYTWSATAPVKFDFHGEPDGAPARYAESYGKGEAGTGRGAFTAPKPGIHGWFWENPGATRVKVMLSTAGFYSASTEYRDGERIVRTFPER